MHSFAGHRHRKLKINSHEPPPLEKVRRGELKRALGLIDCMLLVIGGVIGSGIFLTPSNIAQTTQNVGAFFFVWVAGGVLSFCGAMTYAELGAAFPRAGGIYVFLREAYGRMPAFLYGWCVFFVILTGSMATLASAFSIYLSYLFPLTQIGLRILPVSVIGILTIVNCFGVRWGARVQNLLTGIKISSLLGMIIVLFISDKGTFQHFSQSQRAIPSPSLSALGIAMIAVLWTYDGWHLLTFAAGEIKNPKKNVTAGLLLGMLVIIVFYVLVNMAYLYILPFQVIAGSSRVASHALELAVGPWGGTLVAVAILISIAGAINSNVMGGTRVFFAMASERLFFRPVAYVHPRYKVPTISILATGIWAGFLTMIGSFERLFSYVMFVSWIFFALGAGAVIVLRRKRPDIERPYRVWGYPWVPALFILVATAFVVNAAVNNFKNSSWGLLVIFTGLPAYFYWSRRRRAVETRPC